jgi:hypothetical protein
MGQGVQNQVGQAVTGLRQWPENYSGNSSEVDEVDPDPVTDPGVDPRNARLQGYIDQSNTPLSSSEFLRNPYAERRIDDMRQEDASRQAYLQHQQAMNGTDANAAWAQSAMERAQAEESINDFASAAASQQWDRMSALASDWLDSGDPALIAKAAQYYNYMMPGSGVDFTGLITEANAGQFNYWLKQGTAMAASGSSADEMYAWYKANTGGQFDDDTLKWMAAQATTSEYAAAKNILMNDLRNYPPDVQEDLLIALELHYLFPEGTGEAVYTVKDAKGNVVGTYSTREEANAANAEIEGGSVTAGAQVKEPADVTAEKEAEEGKKKKKEVAEKVAKMKGYYSEVKEYEGQELRDILDELLEKSKIPNGVGVRENNVVRGGAYGRNGPIDGYKVLQDAYSDGGMVFHDGNYYRVVEARLNDGGHFGYDYIDYTLEPVGGGPMITFTGKR